MLVSTVVSCGIGYYIGGQLNFDKSTVNFSSLFFSFAKIYSVILSLHVTVIGVWFGSGDSDYDN